MLRRCFFIFTLLIILLQSSYSFANTATLTGCTIYQIGASDFVLKLQGKNLPTPSPEFDGETMSITLEDTMTSKLEAINSSVMSFVETAPLLYDFSIENLSDDKVSITLKANAVLELHSGSRTMNGYSLWIVARKKPDSSVNSVISPPPKPAITYPENTLPFMSDTKITIELRDAELRDVLRLLMAQIGRNIIIDTSFPNDILITMSLFDVRIDEVLNHLMRTYDIACYDSGKNTTTFGTLEGLYKLSGAKKIKSFNISYADLTQTVAMLRNLTALQENEITIDERMRTLFVNTNPAKMEEVEDLISQIDVPSRQVMIRASIFEFNDTATREVENAIQIAYDEWQINAGGSGGISLNYQEDRTLTNRNPRTARTIEAAFMALETQNKGRVVANPSVIAVDGQEATIELTQSYTYSIIRDDAGNPISQQEDVGPTLTFTPRIERDGYIYLELELETGDVVGAFQGTPIVSDRNVTTKVRVRDGMPFVVGGLFQESKRNEVAKIPVIGDIPLLGKLFTYKSNNNQRTQAVMVVTPYILND